MIAKVLSANTADRWATKEGERQGITPDGETKRRILGEEIVKGIRFPLMSQTEFVAVVYDTAILSWKETGDMMKYYSNVLKSPLPFSQDSRKVFRVNRFDKHQKPGTNWNYSLGLPDIVCFSVSKPITLFGIQHFGSSGGRYTVSTEVKDKATDFTLTKRSGTYASEKDENNNYYGFDVLFDKPVCLEANKKYKLGSLLNGPVSWSGKDGRISVEAEGVQFTFISTGEESNGTSRAGGNLALSLGVESLLTVREKNIGREYRDWNIAMAAEVNWQTKLPTLVGRTAFIFNNELLSDVKFVVPMSSEESKTTKVIPAHKFELPISSPLFFAMFYGQTAKTKCKDSIELLDCDYEGLFVLFRFFYSDEVTLSGSNVMQVMYLANKYMVPSLAEKCTEHLRDNLTAANVLSILPHAQNFEDKDLEDRCWKREALNVKEVELFKAVDRWATKEGDRQGITPDGETKRRILGEEIVKGIRFPLMSQTEFATVVYDTAILSRRETSDKIKYYKNVLKTPLPFSQGARKREVLRVKEVELFKAVDRWAIKEGERQRITPDGNTKRRRILGEEIVKAIRFPLMSQKEFATVVYDTAILSQKETGDMIKYYSNVLKSPLPFLQGARKEFPRFRVSRFNNYSEPYIIWKYNEGLPDIVHFSVNKPIKLLGVQHFGSPGGSKYTVSTEVKITATNFTVVKRSGTFTSEKDENNCYYGFDVLFDKPVCLEANYQYKLESLIKGPASWYGSCGRACVRADGVQFTLSSIENEVNRTSVKSGQFPAFIFN
ncbi:BTB/POZ domain-containing protein 6 [Stylophora pistillata]|uniref:BTB/POZ domain-containing protein 6 n=1 Tax=Stylophora pistillata TaxID=50429 RepID=A0A2B4S9M7_STYPI|nr:BTB/POZ domain-containing protein 6 [Stylophora pistillata]